MRILVQFFHPALEKSRVHRRLVEAARRVDGITFRDVYELYPAFDIDVGAEQQMLLGHDVVIFQHPLYWYSGPALLKQWLDLVLEHGWAYGRRGMALRGKLAMHALSSGGGRDAYSASGLNRRELGEFLLPFEQTALLCRMRWLPPFAVSGTHRLEDAEIERAATEYARLLGALRDGELDLEALARLKRANDAIAPLGPTATGGA
jgi:glutathione-regulated potassium-efflux system ancillary protein KefG